MDSLSNSGLAHPPRSNPRLRSSSCSPPFPCITPSTDTWIVVVSFMSSPVVWGPSWAVSHPRHEQLRPDPTPPHGFPSGTFWYAGGQRSGSATVSGQLRSLPHVRARRERTRAPPLARGGPVETTKDPASMVDRWRRSSSSKSPSTAQNLSASLVSGARCWGTSYRLHRRGLLPGTITIARCHLRIRVHGSPALIPQVWARDCSFSA